MNSRRFPLSSILSALLVLASRCPAQQPPENQAFPPVIAAWTEAANFLPQRNAAVQLNKDLQAAIARGDKTFTIPPGNYRFHPDTLPNLELKNAHDLTIEATGATFWLYPFQRLDGIVMEHCRNVTLHGLIVDYYPATYPQGEITGIDPVQGFIDFQVAPGFSTPMDVPGHLTDAKLLHFDQKGDFIETKMDWVRDLQDLGNGKYRVFPKQGAAYKLKTDVHPGTVLALAGRTMRMAFYLHESDHCTLEDITVYASPHMVFTESFGEGGHVYRHCRVVTRPGTRRFIAANADIFHSIGVAHGPTIEGCEFSRSGDDLINIHGLLALAFDQPAPDQIEVLSQIAPDYPANTNLHFFNLDSLEPKGEARVLSTAPVDDPAENTTASQMITDRQLAFIKPARLIRVQLDRPVNIQKYTLIAADSRVANGTIIRGNFLHDCQSHGILLKSTNGLIDGNRIDNVGIGSIGIVNAVHFMEGPFSAHMTVQNNTITRNGLCSLLSRGDYIFDIGAISVTVERSKGLSEYESNADIKVINNKIENSSNCGIFISNLDGGVVAGNTIIDPVSKEPLNLGRRMGLVNPAYGLVVANSSNIRLENNVVAKPGQFCRGPIAFIDAVKNVGPQHP
jgi:parallel beta-helix repeat protein